MVRCPAKGFLPEWKRFGEIVPNREDCVWFSCMAGRAPHSDWADYTTVLIGAKSGFIGMAIFIGFCFAQTGM